MTLIGLTGNIATGKSFVASVLRELGAVVIDGDVVARDVVEIGTPTLALIAEEFGPAVLLPNGALHRKALGDIVFNQPQHLRRLEQIMQPAIRAELQARIDAVPKDQVGVVEAIRLIEGKWDAQCDQVWVTDCPREVQLSRLMQGRGLSEADARTRIDAQADPALKRARADVVIDTNTTLEDTRAQVVAAWERLLQSK